MVGDIFINGKWIESGFSSCGGGFVWQIESEYLDEWKYHTIEPWVGTKVIFSKYFKIGSDRIS